MQLHFHTTDPNIRASVTSFLEEWNSEKSYFIVQTSGSTGKPKSICIQKAHARASAQMTGTFLNLSEGTNALLSMSTDTIAGKMMIIRALEWNLVLHVTEPKACPFESLTEKMDFVAMVPYQVARSLQKHPEAFHESMQLIIGGGAISPELEKEIQQLDCQAYHSFGMTETISHIALRNISKKEKAFQLLEGVTAQEKKGQLEISAPHLGVQELRTNDCVQFLNDRSFIWKGRMDFVVNSGGVKIHPEEVEKQIAPLIDVPFFVIGVPDDALGEILILCVESNECTLRKSAFASVLPKYHIPKHVYLYERFEYTRSEKINRLATLENLNRNEQPIL